MIIMWTFKNLKALPEWSWEKEKLTRALLHAVELICILPYRSVSGQVELKKKRGKKSFCIFFNNDTRDQQVDEERQRTSRGTHWVIGWNVLKKKDEKSQCDEFCIESPKITQFSLFTLLTWTLSTSSSSIIIELFLEYHRVIFSWKSHSHYRPTDESRYVRTGAIVSFFLFQVDDQISWLY